MRVFYILAIILALFQTSDLWADSSCKMLVLDGQPGIVLPGQLIEPMVLEEDIIHSGGYRENPILADLLGPLYAAPTDGLRMRDVLQYGANPFSLRVLDAASDNKAIFENFKTEGLSVTELSENFSYSQSMSLYEEFLALGNIEDYRDRRASVMVSGDTNSTDGDIRVSLNATDYSAQNQSEVSAKMLIELVNHLRELGISEEGLSYLNQYLNSATAKMDCMHNQLLRIIRVRWSSGIPKSPNFVAFHVDGNNRFTGTLPLLGSGSDILTRNGKDIEILRGPTGHLMSFPGLGGPSHSAANHSGPRLVILFFYGYLKGDPELVLTPERCQ